MDHPDVADVVAATAGDVAAFERIVRAMQGPVWRYIIHLIGDPALAEDVAQEVFVRTHRKLHTLRDPDRFVAWLFTLARNAAYDAARSRRRRPLELVGDRELPVPHSGDPHLGLEVREALDELEPDLREVVVLIGMLGLSYAEAAGTIGVPEGTVKSRMFRARRVLMDVLEWGGADAT